MAKSKDQGLGGPLKFAEFVCMSEKIEAMLRSYLHMLWPLLATANGNAAADAIADAVAADIAAGSYAASAPATPSCCSCRHTGRHKHAQTTIQARMSESHTKKIQPRPQQEHPAQPQEGRPTLRERTPTATPRRNANIEKEPHIKRRGSHKHATETPSCDNQTQQPQKSYVGVLGAHTARFELTHTQSDLKTHTRLDEATETTKYQNRQEGPDTTRTTRTTKTTNRNTRHTTTTTSDHHRHTTHTIRENSHQFPNHSCSNGCFVLFFMVTTFLCQEWASCVFLGRQSPHKRT